jgi:hypothetical protein
MTPQHVEALLALLVSLDPRLRAPDASTAELRVSAWSSLLAEVDPAYAVRFAELAYQEIRDWPLTPAEILQGWRSEQREAAEAPARDPFDDGGRRGLGRSGWSPQVLDFLREALAAVARGEDPAAVPRPDVAVRPLTAAQDSWQRRCVFHRICACDHTTCRDGFLDAEETVVGWEDLLYPSVVRCPHCEDALKMAVEQGLAKKPAYRARRRAGATA